MDESRYRMRDASGCELKFTDSQKKCIDYNADSILVIKGTAGSGKSMMIVKRALEERKKAILNGKKEKICILIFTKSLVRGMRSVIKSNIKDEKEQNPSSKLGRWPDDYLCIDNVDSYLVRLCAAIEKRNPRLKLFPDWSFEKASDDSKWQDDDGRIALVSLALKNLAANDNHPYYRRDPEFWADEILWMYRNGIVDEDDKDTYMCLKREGRCKKYREKMNEKGRSVAFKIFTEYNHLMLDYHKAEWERLYALLCRSYLDYIPEDYKFDYLLIDEAQDLSLVKMKILCNLYRTELNVAMDLNQSIYGHRWSLKKDLGKKDVHVKKLEVMFRSTQEIDLLSQDLKKVEDTLLEKEDTYENEMSNIQSGTKPKVVKCKDANSEMQYIANEIKALYKENPGATLAILCKDRHNLATFKTFLKKNGITAVKYFRDNDFDPYEPGIKLITLHSAKGLGFTWVYIPYLNEGVYPNSAESIINSIMKERQDTDDVDYDEAIAEQVSESRRMLYVGITRAVLDVTMTYSGKPSRFIGEFNPDHYVLIDTNHELVNDPDIVVKTSLKNQVAANSEFLDERTEQSTGFPGIDDGGELNIELESDPVLFLVKSFGLEYVDKRSVNSVLWIIDGPGVKEKMEQISSMGYELGYSKVGSRSTNRRAAYYYGM